MQEVGIVAKKRILAACVILIFSAIVLSDCARRRSESVTGIEIGSPAPNFQLPDLTGKEVTLNQYKGKIVLLDFWATWCVPCRMTMPLLEKLQKEYSDVMVQVAVNLEEPKNVVRDYVQAHGIHALVLLDEDGSVGQAYEVEGIPRQVLIDKNGVVRYIQTGFDSRMASLFRTEIQKLR
jgi:thiol-disulfide isomerase/thioredoxin